MVQQRLSELRAVAIVPCKSLSETNFATFLKSNEGVFDHIVFSTQQEASFLYGGTINNTSILNFPHQSGISAARNRGIESIFTSNTIYFFPNISTFFEPEYVSHVLKLFSADTSIGAISGNYIFKGQTKRSYSTGPLQGHSLFLAYEPTLAISSNALKANNLKFDENLGTGNSRTKRWSGEGTELLFRLSKCGFKVIHLNEIASYDHRERPSHPISVDYKYGRGYIYVTRTISGTSHAIYRALRTINKLIPTYRVHKNRELKLLNACAFISGAWCELISMQNRKPK